MPALGGPGGLGAVAAGEEPAASLLLTGSGLYLVGTIALTAVYHVPRNDALACVEPEGPDTARRRCAGDAVLSCSRRT